MCSVQVTASGEVDVTGTGYRPVGEILFAGQPLDESAPGDAALAEEVRVVLSGGSLANDAVLREDGHEWTIQGDPTEAAFLVAEAKVRGQAERRASRFVRVGEVPFSSERKLMTTFEADAERDGGIAVVTKGAPDVLLSRCTHERVGSRIRPLTDRRRNEILATVDRLADDALRTLAVSCCTAVDILGYRRGTDERDGTHGWVVEQGIDGLLPTVDQADYTGRQL